MNQKLKIGVLLDNATIPLWHYKVLNDLSNSDYAELVFVIISDYKGTLPDKSLHTIAHHMLSLLEKIDRLLFKGSNDYNLGRSVSDLFTKIPILYLNDLNELEISKNSSREITSGELMNLDSDLLIKFGVNNFEGAISKIPRYGIWTYSIDGCNKSEIIKSGFREVVKSLPVTTSNLFVANGHTDDMKIIFSSQESTCPYSIHKNRNIVSWRASLFMPRIINGIYQYGESYLDLLKHKFQHVGSEDNNYNPESSLTASIKNIFSYVAVGLRYIKKNILYTYDFRWSLFFDIKEDAKWCSEDFGNFRKLKSPKNIYWADPFVVAADNHYFIFVEEFVYRTHKAHISVLELDEHGKLLRDERIIERPYHMSYPFIFKIDTTYYLIPETSDNRTIELYRCTDFPYKWEFYKNIMENLSAVDTTLFYHNNKWWLFTSIDQTDNISGCSTELFLYYSDDVFSDKWVSHPCNPIISDSRSARPAGNLFFKEGKIYRPAQDCSVRYGKGFKLCQVIKLSETEYEEIITTEVEPVWDNKLKGTHTINFDKGLTVIDVYSFRRRFS